MRRSKMARSLRTDSLVFGRVPRATTALPVAIERIRDIVGVGSQENSPVWSSAVASNAHLAGVRFGPGGGERGSPVMQTGRLVLGLRPRSVIADGRQPAGHRQRFGWCLT
jgi:hypothetical protein